MLKFEIETLIVASPEICFDLARDIDFHAQSLAATSEIVVDRPARGLLELADEVEFEGRHLGVVQRHRARIMAFDRPWHFRDEMVHGAFRAFVHDHDFEVRSNGTLMRDRVQCSAPLGILGRLVEIIVLKPYLRRLIRARARAIKVEAEACTTADVLT